MSDISLELKTKDGDFELLNSTQSLLQDQSIIIESDKGKIINDLLMGVGIIQYLNGPSQIIPLKNNIKTELKKDGINVTSIQVRNGELVIDSYK